jgi:REP element-mobilizing transposase RayT
VPLLAYFITFHTYGTWLHGHEEGSVDRTHNTPGEALLSSDRSRERSEHAILKHAPVVLNDSARRIVDDTIREVCRHRGWTIRALHVRSNHVHVVVSAVASPEKVLTDLKAYSTRRLREAGLIGFDTRVWSHHGSTRYLDSPESAQRAIEYTDHYQGEPLP